MELPEKLSETILNLDLAGRIPYGVKVKVDHDALCDYDSDWKKWNFDEEPQELDTISINGGVAFSCLDQWDGLIPIRFVKPYLFPLSSLTDEDIDQIKLRTYFDLDLIKSGKFELDGTGDMTDILSLIDEFNKRNIDYRRLIDMDLAEDATDKHIYDL